MQINHLRHILSRQSIFIAVLPFVFLALMIIMWLFPIFVKDAEIHNIELSKMIALKAESHLVESMSIIQGISNYIQTCKEKPDYQLLLNAQILASQSLGAIYVIDPDGKVAGVSLKNRDLAQEQDLTGLDLSGNPLFKKAMIEKKPIWSDTFLSIVGGGISVALAIPSKYYVIMGEIDLRVLSDYLGQIADTGEQVIMVLDRRGQVIADDDGSFTAQQLNLSHIPFVKKGLDEREASTGEFKLNGKEMKGYMINASLIDWHVLVATPKKAAYQSVWTGAIWFSIAFIITIAIGILAAVLLAGRLARRFENLAAHTREIAAGKQIGEWPSFSIFEFEKLAGDIQQMADSMREREVYSRLLFEDSPVPLLVIDPNSLKCLDGNESLIRLLDISIPRSLTGYSILDFSAKEQSDNMDSASRSRYYIDQSLKHGFVNYEWLFFSKAKGIWYGDISLSSFRHGQKNLVQMSIIDITKRKTEESRRKSLEKQLIQARKMESIGTLAGGIAHDFNNILFPVMGFTEMVIDDLPDDSTLRPSLQEVLKGCGKARDLVDKILTFSRQDSKKYKPLQVHLVIEEILASTKANLPENINIHQDISNKGCVVMADFDHIHLITLNLITNALSAMEKSGGQLSLTLDNVQFLSGELQDVNLIPGWYVCLKVSDTGPGIAPEIQDMIFDPYFSTKGKGKDKGTGLGLSVVHGIVKSYQGEITVESKTGKGAVFRVYLPRFVFAGKNKDTLEYNYLTGRSLPK